jgi:uncharacterized protein YjdB
MSFRAHTAIVLCFAALGCGGGGGVAGPPAVASVSVVLGQPTIVVGGTTTAVATLKDAGGNVLTGRTIGWSSDNSAVATVSLGGVVTAVGAGSARITATSEGASGSATLTVTIPPVASVTVSLAASHVVVGATTQATATTKDANGVTLTGRTVSWSSDNSAVATVSGSGAFATVTAISVGTANIIATSEGHTGQAMVTVVSSAVASVSVSLAPSTIGIGRTSQATATTKDANGDVVTGRTVTWASDNTSVATVVATTGVVTGVAIGSAHITATSEGQIGSATITVAPQLGYGSASEKIHIVDIGTAFTPTLTGPSGATTTFVSRATSVATVDAQGTIHGVGEGQAWVAASASGWVGDSVYVIVPRNSTGPVLRTDLTTFNVSPGTTNYMINVILDTRSTPIGGAEMTVGYTTVPNIFTAGSYNPAGSPVPVVSNLQAGLLRLSLASGNPLSGPLTILQLSFTVTSTNASGFVTLTFIDLVAPDGTDLLPVSTSTRIPIIVHD